ncbi:nSTAND1 domain-containing NTPase [Streptomyces tsukubensis]|uniref:nSTAND1 domain-containing NTPase n=1 Tax=Streptomyces tsukubensis TaxID=83656 RepID=UPI00344B6A21
MAGRREVPVDPEAGPVQAFAHELRGLRETAGTPTYRELARRVGYSASALSQAAGGRELPSLKVALAYAAACGGDPGEWEERWRRADTAVREPGDAVPDEEAPYRGLARYEAVDGGLFFGRAGVTAELLSLVDRNRFVLVFGPSGCGKSSLLRAAVIPALLDPGRREPTPSAVRVLTPGPRPGAHGRLLAHGRGPGDVLVVVDQFEEVFTLCRDAEEREAFLRTLLAARRPENGLRVVCVVRADFYRHCAEHPGLAAALHDAQLAVPPLSPKELRDAVVKPATAAGLIVERELTALLTEEVAGRPGALPLLSHALLETWRRRRGKVLTIAGYREAGGLDGAVAQTAEALYAGLGPGGRAAARLLLLRLVAPGGDGVPDTRRPVAGAELGALRAGERTGPVVETLTAARLVTLGDESLELTHEALLTAWPRLRGWIDEDRERLRVHRALTDAARLWQTLDRDPGALYRGTLLARAEEQLRPDGLTPFEGAFLTAGLDARDRERRAAVHGARRIRRLRTVLTLIAALALVAGGVAWEQSRVGARERSHEEARRIAALAENLRRSDPARAMRLGLAAYRIADLPETRAAVMTAATQREESVFPVPEPAGFTDYRLSGNGRTLLHVGEGRFTVWDVESGRRTGGPGDIASAPLAQAVSDTGDWAVVYTEDDMVLWDVRAGRGRTLPGALNGVALTPDGRFLLVGFYAEGRWDRHSGRLEVWERSSLRVVGRLTVPLAPGDWPVVRLSPDGRLLAVCRPGVRVEVWDMAGGRAGSATRRGQAPYDTDCSRTALPFGFTPDSRRLVNSDSNGLRVWDIASGQEVRTLPREAFSEVAFSSDGRHMAGIDSAGISLWYVGGPPALLLRYPLPRRKPIELRFDERAKRIRYVIGDEVHALDLTGLLPSHWYGKPALAAAYGPDASVLAVARPDARTGRTRVQLSGADGGKPHVLPGSCPPPEGPGIPPCTVSLAFRKDGRVLAYRLSPGDFLGLWPAAVHLWDRNARRLSTTEVTYWGHQVYRWNTAEHLVTEKILMGALPQEKEMTMIQGLAFSGGKDELLVAVNPDPSSGADFHDDDHYGKYRGRNRALRAGDGGISLSPDGDRLATRSGAVVDLPSGRTTSTGREHAAVLYSPDGKQLATTDALGQITLWTADGSERLAVLPAVPSSGAGAPAAVTVLAFAPDGRTLAAADSGGTLRLWDTVAQRQLAALPSAGGAVLSLAFSPDGSTLHSATRHGPPQRHAVGPERLAADVCKRVGTGLSPAEWRLHIRNSPYRPTCPGP